MPALFFRPMRHTTALGVGALAFSLIGVLYRRPRLGKAGAYGAIVISALAMISQVIRWSRLEMPPQTPLPAYAEIVYTAFPNALCLFAGGLALALLTTRRPSIHRLVLAGIGGTVCGVLAFCSALNEILGLLPANPAFEGEIAIDATLSLTLIGIAILRIATARAEGTGEEVSLFRPVFVAMLGTIASFLIWRSLLQERSSAVAYEATVTTEATVRAVKAEMLQRLSEVRHSAAEPTPRLFEETGLSESKGMRWTTTQAITAGKSDWDKRLRPVLARYLQQTRDLYFVYDDPVAGPLGVFVAPIPTGGERVAVVRFADVIEPVIANIVGANFQVFYLRNGRELYRYPDPPRANEMAGKSELRVPEIDGVLRLHPASQFVRRGGTWAAQLALAIGLNVSFLLAFSAYLLQVARSRLTEVQIIRSGLEREVEERRKAEAELARKAKQLETSNADLREFAHVTSHDLQEPLRSISGFAQLLVKRYYGKFDADADEFLGYIIDSSTRMSGMIQGLLLYSRVVHSTELDEDVPLADAVEFATSNLLLAIDESNIDLQVGPLPVARGNRLQFGQLMQNLLGNAIKYRGPDPLQVSISAASRGGEHVITVADNGIGISSEFQERIFGLFKRAHGKDYPGAGVGLALCKKIVERHGGRIWVESSPGNGARFHFTIPAG